MSAATQICRHLQRLGVSCEEIKPGAFNIDNGNCSLLYYGEGEWKLRYLAWETWTFNSTSPKFIVNQVMACIGTYENFKALQPLLVEFREY